MDKDNSYGLNALHKELLNLLESFEQLCVQNNIKYSLGFGSMLGAVRNHGIIPWDDDIDVIIDRHNYYLLENVIKLSKNFELIKNTKESLWIPRLRRPSGVANKFSYTPTIDLFIIDNVPDSRLIARIKLFLVLCLQGMLKRKLSIQKGSIFMKVASLITFIVGHIIPSSFKFWLLEKISSISNKKKTQYCTTYNVEYLYVGKKYKNTLLDDLIYMPFDDIKVPISKIFDSYLTTLYGNYTIPPQMQDRLPKHT